MKCRKCGSTDLVVKQEMFRDGSGPHSRCSCVECGSFYGFLGKEEKKKFAGQVLDGIIEPEKDKFGNSSVKLKDLDFKLDLIIDHLGIKNGKII